MSLRLKRLAIEARLLQEQFGAHPRVRVMPAGGDPPDRYVVEYRISGLERLPDGTLVVRGEHRMEIVLPAEYPRQPAACRMLTPVFHPNIDVFTVCTSDFHAAQETLSDLIVRVGQMIAFQKHNVKSPLNAEAAIWCEENLARLPVDRADLYPSDVAPRPATTSAPGAAPVIVAPPPPGSQLPVRPIRPVSLPPVSVSPPPPPNALAPPPAPPPAQHSIVIRSTAPTPGLFPRPYASDMHSEDVVDEVELDVELGNAPGLSRVRARAGEVVRCRSGSCMLGLRAEPMRAELRSMSGTVIRGIAPRQNSSVALGDQVVCVHDTCELSVGVLADGPFLGERDQPAARRFWNSVCATEVTLAERLVAGLTPGRTRTVDRADLLGVARAKLEYIDRVLESGTPSPAWRASL